MDSINATSETIKEPVSILSRIKNGKPLYEIAAEDKISMGEANLKLNTELMQEKKNKDEELKNKIISHFEKGFAFAEISKELDISYEKTRKVITNWSGYQNAVNIHNEENPNKAIFISARQKEERNSAAATAFAEGKSAGEIARQFHLNCNTVYNILHKKGIQVKKTRLTGNAESKTPDKSYNYELVQQIIAAYTELRDIPKTAERVNADYAMVYRILRSNKMTQPKQYKKEEQLMNQPHIIIEIKNAHREQLTVSEISERTGISRKVIKKFLINNNLAIRKGSAIDAENKKKILVAYLQSKAKLLGRTPSKEEILKDTVHNYMQYYRAFGSYKKAIEEAGLKNSSHCKREKTEAHKIKLLDELLRISIEIKKTPEEEDINKHSKYPLGEFNRNFDSLKDACRKAGLEVKNEPVNKTTNEELILYLKELSQRHGCTPSITLLKKEKRFNALLFIRRFGNWNTALLTAGFTPRLIIEAKPVNREETLKRVKEYIQQHGVPVVQILRKECKISELFLYRFFGSYKKLIKEATTGAIQV